MVALAPITNETPAWDVLDTFPKLHSRAREAKPRFCTEAPHSKSLDRVEIWLTIFESRVGLESFTRDPIGFEGSEWSLYELFASAAMNGLDPTGTTTFCGSVLLGCKDGPIDFLVYGDSARARDILKLDPNNPSGSGCVTLPQGIECSGSCDDIKNKVKTRSTGGKRVPILEHEGCHACLMKDNLGKPRKTLFGDLCNWKPYVSSWGGYPDGCVGNEVSAKPEW